MNVHDQKAGEIIDSSEGDERGSELEKKLQHNVSERANQQCQMQWRTPEQKCCLCK